MLFSWHCSQFSYIPCQWHWFSRLTLHLGASSYSLFNKIQHYPWPHGFILLQTFVYHGFCSTILILNHSFLCIRCVFFQFSISHNAHLFLCFTINTERNSSSLVITALVTNLSLHNLSDSHWSQWQDATTTLYTAIWFWNGEA